MHELGIAEEIHRAALSHVSARGGGRLVSVRVAVGELSAIDPEALRFAWEAVAATDAGRRGAPVLLEVDWRPASRACPRCGPLDPDGAGPAWLAVCPKCGEVIRVSGGDELDLVTVSFETDDDLEAAGQETGFPPEPWFGVSTVGSDEEGA